MGSYSRSDSKTNYTNAPITQENVSNPLNLTNSSAKFGTDITLGTGANLTLNSSSDPQTVGAALDFGSKLVQVVADITRQNNAAAAGAAKDETKAAATDTKAAAAFDWEKYKTELALGAGLLVWWLWGRKK